MSDIATPTPAAPAAHDPFNDNDWRSTETPSPAPEGAAPAPEGAAPVTEPAPAPAPEGGAAPSPTNQEEVFDADAYLNQQLGLTSWDEAKAIVEEVKTLREKTKNPEPYKYANETSERIAKAINEGKSDDVRRYLDQQHKLNVGKALDPNDKASAADIVKLSWQLQNQDLSSDDVEFMFRKKFSTPRKPEPTIDQTDADYAEVVAEWQSTVKDVERELMIEAKLLKPKLSQYESSLVLPDTSKGEATPAAPAPPTPEELATQKADRDRYLSLTDTGIKNLKEFKALVKDEEVELPVSYLISDEERAKTKAITESLYGSFDYFVERWKNADGSLNEAKLAEDITLLENREKIFQKIANESAAKRMAHKVAASRNINIQPNTGSGRPVLQTNDKDKATAEFWQNS